MHPEELCSQCRELASSEPEPSETSWQEKFLQLRGKLFRELDETLLEVFKLVEKEKDS